MKTKLLIFGITGDLSRRKLLPALEQIVQSRAVEDLSIVGVSRKRPDVHIPDVLRPLVSFVTMDVADKEAYSRLAAQVAPGENEQLLVYLSVPPTAATQIADFLGEVGLNGKNVKLLFEKPFGVDLLSAKALIERTARYFDDSQLYRIDHYLAKEMAQNIVAFRSGNALFRHVWDNSAIERIEIVSSETIGIEGRAQFYEQTGALRDVVQGHLMQLLSLILMDIPAVYDESMLPQLRVSALRKITEVDPQRVVSAQYDTYQQEVNNRGSLTETFVALELFSVDNRWKNVPIVLATGKAIDKKTTEIRIFFKREHDEQANSLVFHIQPNEGVELELYSKKLGYEYQFERQKMAFTYSKNERLPDAYEQVLVDAIRSKKSLFASSEEVLESWRILQPIIDTWQWGNISPKLYRGGASTHDICSVLLMS